MQSGVIRVSGVAAAVLSLIALPGAVRAQSRAPSTPPEMVTAYDALADAILGANNAERKPVIALLTATYGHAQSELRARATGLEDQRRQRPRSHREPGHGVRQLGTEGDNAVAGVRKRLSRRKAPRQRHRRGPGHYDKGYVIVTKVAKQASWTPPAPWPCSPRPRGREPVARMEEGGGHLKKHIATASSAGGPAEHALASAGGLVLCGRGRAARGGPAGGARPFHFTDVAAPWALRACSRPSAGQGSLLDSAAPAPPSSITQDGAWTSTRERGGSKAPRWPRAAGTPSTATRRRHFETSRTRRRGRRGAMGSGRGRADYDNDGWADVLVTNFGRNFLTEPRQRHFENVARQAGARRRLEHRRRVLRRAGDGWLDLHRAYVDTALDDVLKASPACPGAGGAGRLRPLRPKRGPDHFFRNVKGRSWTRRKRGDEGPRAGSGSRFGP